ncbi:ribonuclease domain-containing protein [Actinoalloteichus spitiensis]|uniref:ribonuclease domain-containing protein n=1 Tax=Actinoalloteichus spitiensis TaxID=252394 RepID=UPI000360389E|nr:ribonuclease domain-containing protein [Actinoalloteichus spitiensis]
MTAPRPENHHQGLGGKQVSGMLRRDRTRNTVAGDATSRARHPLVRDRDPRPSRGAGPSPRRGRRAGAARTRPPGPITALLLAVLTVGAAACAPAAPLVGNTHSTADRPGSSLPVDEFPDQVGRACGIWADLSWPVNDQAVDHPAGGGLVIRGGNQYHNYGEDLPLEGSYREYDVNPRPPGQRRDAERLVRDRDTHEVWYTADHYESFRRISGGCG